MARHGGEEIVALDRQQLQVAESDHRRRAWNVAQERNLAEVVAGMQRLDALPVDLDPRLAVNEHVETVARVALADHLLPGAHELRSSLVRQLLDDRRGEGAEDVDRPQELGVGRGSGSFDVEAPQSRPPERS